MDMDSNKMTTTQIAAEAARRLCVTCGVPEDSDSFDEVVSAFQAAIEKATEPLKAFIERCADHMICGSNIADTPLPTEQEWRDILGELRAAHASEQKEVTAEAIARKAALRLTPESDETFEFNFHVILNAVEDAMAQPLPVICCKCGQPKTYVPPAHASEPADQIAAARHEILVWLGMVDRVNASQVDAIDSSIKSAIERQREIDFGWLRKMFKDTLDAPDRAAHASEDKCPSCLHVCERDLARAAHTSEK